jgi:hypothetical protein
MIAELGVWSIYEFSDNFPYKLVLVSFLFEIFDNGRCTGDRLVFICEFKFLIYFIYR